MFTAPREMGPDQLDGNSSGELTRGSGRSNRFARWFAKGSIRPPRSDEHRSRPALCRRPRRVPCGDFRRPAIEPDPPSAGRLPQAGGLVERIRHFVSRLLRSAFSSVKFRSSTSIISLPVVLMIPTLALTGSETGCKCRSRTTRARSGQADTGRPSERALVVRFRDLRPDREGEPSGRRSPPGAPRPVASVAGEGGRPIRPPSSGACPPAA